MVFSIPQGAASILNPSNSKVLSGIPCSNLRSYVHKANQNSQSTDNTATIAVIHTQQQHSLCFNGHFSGGAGLTGIRMSPFWILLKLRMMEVVVTTGAIRRTNLQSKCHHQQKPRPSFLQADASPITQPTASKR